jgi:arginase family enzyme
MGGDHCISAATITGALKVHKDLKVVWIDAHTDCKSTQLQTPPVMHSQNYHTIPLGHVTGMHSIPELPYWSWLTDLPFLDPKNIVLIGLRDMIPE